ncbi:putative sporulation protein YtxC [Anaerobacillus alkaliphilus]|uniref:putative sporulation protein YtxC n=1 Tax=Anaerobacillus alkaliphilus TaxID=1548597 RepID=UPI0013758A8F|nr:putative sporulation protein YtxC [Anaerobacillus alkaliphilus]
MIEIYLQNKLDRYDLLTNFKAGLQAFIKNEEVELSEVSDKLFIKVDDTVDFNETIKPALTKVLKKHVVETKEDAWLLDIIENIFFYENEEEQSHILVMAKSILAGERLDLPNVTKLFSTEKIIEDAFNTFLTRDCNFCYDSFLTFRLRGYLDKLIDCVEMAIDEFRLEQEYQNLLESLRFYLKKRLPRLNCVHLVIDKEIFFYDEFFQPISDEKLETFLDREIVFEKEIPIQEMVISPLVSIAPKEVHLYSNDIDSGVIHSIQNIFQEKVQIYSKSVFEKKNYKMH